jgi:hypothetical protein
MMPIISPVLFQVQKNKQNGGATVVTVLDGVKISALFKPAVKSTCKISGWYISSKDSNLQMAATEDIAIRMMQVKRTIGLDDIKVNSTQGPKDVTIQFKLQTYLRSLEDPFKWYNPNSLTVKVNYCCIEEKLTSFWDLIEEVAHENFISADKTTMLFVYPYPNDAVAVTSKIDINKIYKFLADFKGCVPEEISAYTDALH